MGPLLLSTGLDIVKQPLKTVVALVHFIVCFDTFVGGGGKTGGAGTQVGQQEELEAQPGGACMRLHTITSNSQEQSLTVWLHEGHVTPPPTQSNGWLHTRPRGLSIEDDGPASASSFSYQGKYILLSCHSFR